MSKCQECYKHKNGCDYYAKYVEQNKKAREALLDFETKDFKATPWRGLHCKHFRRTKEETKLWEE